MDGADEHNGRLLLRRGGSSLRHILDTHVSETDRVHWVAEVAVVSQRMFKDMLRKPSLVTTHVGAFTYFGGTSALFLYEGSGGVSLEKGVGFYSMRNSPRHWGLGGLC